MASSANAAANSLSVSRDAGAVSIRFVRNLLDQSLRIYIGRISFMLEDTSYGAVEGVIIVDAICLFL